MMFLINNLLYIYGNVVVSALSVAIDLYHRRRGDGVRLHPMRLQKSFPIL